ncbi:MAG TPA: WYL domain-containing protein [Euzebyales bacterium]
MRSTSTRLLQLLALLTTRPWWSAAELADALDVTERTVRRDIGRLRDLAYPVESVRGPSGGYRLGRGGRLPPLLLDEEEAVAVAVCLRAGAAGTVTGVEEAATRALAKLEQTLPAHLRSRARAVDDATVTLPRRSGTPVASDLLVTLAQACRTPEQVRFDYRTHDGVRSRRLVEPYRLVHSGWRWYLVGHDVDREAWRTLRVDRITHVVTTGRRFTRGGEPDAAAMVSRAVSTAPYRWTARVRLHAPVDAVADRVPATVAVLEAEGATTALTTGADDLAIIVAHIAALGIDFTVLDPPELADAVRAMAGRLGRATP